MEVDFIANGQASGNMAARLLAMNMDTKALRTNAILAPDEWRAFDNAVIQVARDRLVGVADLLSRNLVYRTGGMGVTILQTRKQSTFGTATVSMDGTTRSIKDRPEFGLDTLPLPITHSDFAVGARELAISRRMGTDLDTTEAQNAAAVVADTLEDKLFNGWGSYSFGGATIYGYTDFPSRITNSFTAWTASAKTGAGIVKDVLNMKKAAGAKRCYGPFVLYIPAAYEWLLEEDYSTAKGDNTIRDRIMKINNISAIRVADKLATGNLLLVQMTSNVVRMVEGMPLTNVEWNTEGGMLQNFKVMTIQVPQLRADYAGNTGIVHYAV